MLGGDGGVVAAGYGDDGEGDDGGDDQDGQGDLRPVVEEPAEYPKRRVFRTEARVRRGERLGPARAVPVPATKAIRVAVRASAVRRMDCMTTSGSLGFGMCGVGWDALTRWWRRHGG